MTFLGVLARRFFHATNSQIDIATQHGIWTSLPMVVSTVILYIAFILKLGPAFMRYRKPFEINKFIQVFNAMTAAANVYLGFEIIRNFYGPGGSSNLWCEPVDSTENSTSLKAKELAHLFYCLKVADLFETIFLILQKKNSHILSYTHTIVNGSIVLGAWYGLHFLPGGSTAVVVLVNATFSALKYTYLFLKSWDARYENHGWWEKYVALVRLIQLAIFDLYGVQLILFQSCGYPILPFLIIIPPSTVFFLLFLEYYVSIYVYDAITSYDKNVMN